MSSRLPSFRVLLALLAWCAQLCLPMAHAAVMAGQNEGPAWCGPSAATGLQAKLAALPDEVRGIVAPEAVPDTVQDGCVLLCTAASGPALAEPLPVSVVLRAAGLEPAAAPVAFTPLRAHGAPPPARGPPARV